jgi:hypothetical protein
MKTKKKINALATIIAVMVFASCSKNDVFLYKTVTMPVSIKGYNGSSERLIAKIDTFKFKFELSSNSTIRATENFTFPEGKNTAKLSITEENTGKLVLEREMKKEDRSTTINVLYMDGKVSNMPELPAVEAGKIKAVYMLQTNITNYTEPVDIVAGRYWYAPNDVFEEFARIKNVKPYEFSEPIILPTFSTTYGQTYNGVVSQLAFQIRIYKAGTNEPYTQGSGYQWHVTSSPPPKPAAATASSKMYIIKESPSGTQMKFLAVLTL